MINSIDLNTMLPRTAEAADLQGRELSQMQHALDQTAVQFRKETEQMAQRTMETQKAETQEYNLTDKEGGGGDTSSEKKKKRENKRKEGPMAPRSDSSFDLMV